LAPGLTRPKKLGEIRGREVDDAGLQRALYCSSIGEIEHVVGSAVKGKLIVVEVYPSWMSGWQTPAAQLSRASQNVLFKLVPRLLELHRGGLRRARQARTPAKGLRHLLGDRVPRLIESVLEDANRFDADDR